ncbi:sigma-70 family RNA polymerase sigma factor [Anabaena sp. PCC 7108]|uniref:sigma-70 family RNA polymerase sigma factor n=1 Tax=Anabaena sp. PCC 7108 TaxID=163908 RepID=UPI000345F1C0|nr:sigma-70 family RNA polymerase sigma factor [Anabaena sp. PCC 7108]
MSLPSEDEKISLDESTLLKRIVQQDHSALSQLYDRYAQIIYAIAFKSLGSVEESEEVVLDVFSQVWRIAEKYDANKARVDTWLLMMTRSRVLDRLRYLQRTAKTKIASVNVEIQSAKVSVDPIEEVLISERRTLVIAALKQIPEEQRQVIELAYYHGLTHSQIAAQSGLSVGTVKTRIRLGLNKLRIAIAVWK